MCGTWQVVVNGFCGLRISKDKISFNPCIPPEIEGVECVILWRGYNLGIKATTEPLSLLYEAGRNISIEVYVYGERRVLDGGVPYKFERN